MASTSGPTLHGLPPNATGKMMHGRLDVIGRTWHLWGAMLLLLLLLPLLLLLGPAAGVTIQCCSTAISMRLMLSSKEHSCPAVAAATLAE